MVQPFRASAAARSADPTSRPVRDVPGFSVFVGSLIVLATGVVFSFGGLAFRLTDDMNAWQYVIFRGLGALVVTALILAYRYRGRVSALTGPIERSHIAAGLLLGSISAVFIFSLERASVAFVLFLQALAPITSAYFSWILLRERVSRAVLIATAVSIAGVLVMFSATLTDRIDPLGLIAITIPIIFGLYATLIRGAQQIDAQVPILVGGATLVVLGVIGSVATVGFDMSARDMLIGLFAGSMLLAIPGAFLNHATRVVPASEVALLLMSEVILAPVWVWLFVDESPEATTLIGGLIIFSAVLGLLFWRRTRALGARSASAHTG